MPNAKVPESAIGKRNKKWYHLISGHIPAHTHTHMYAWLILHIEHLCLLFNCGHAQCKSCWMDPDWMPHVLECEANRNWTRKAPFFFNSQNREFASFCWMHKNWTERKKKRPSGIFLTVFSPYDWITDGCDTTETRFIYVRRHVLGSDHIAYIRKKKRQKKIQRK